MGFPMAASVAGVADAALALLASCPLARLALYLAAVALSAASVGWLAQDALDRALHGRGRRG